MPHVCTGNRSQYVGCDVLQHDSQELAALLSEKRRTVLYLVYSKAVSLPPWSHMRSEAYGVRQPRKSEVT